MEVATYYAGGPHSLGQQLGLGQGLSRRVMAHVDLTGYTFFAVLHL